MITHLMFNRLIRFQNDHIFQHNGFINVDKKYQDTFFGDDFFNISLI